jgi:hypothetical protein
MFTVMDVPSTQEEGTAVRVGERHHRMPCASFDSRATGSWASAHLEFTDIFPMGLPSTAIGRSVAFRRVGTAVDPLKFAALAVRASIRTAFALPSGFCVLGCMVMVPQVLFGPAGRGTRSSLRGNLEA